MPPKPGELARKAAELKKSKKELVAAQRRERLLKMRIERENEQQVITPENSPFQGSPRYAGEKDYACVDELHRLSRVKANRRRFSMKLIALALGVY